MKKFKNTIICLILLSLIITGVSFMLLSDIIPTHIGIDGKPDQFGSKYFLLLFPLIMAILGLSMILVSKYGKVSDNYRKYSMLTGVIVETILFVINVVFIVYSLLYVEDSPGFDISKIIMIVMGLLFIIMSNFMPKIEKNRTLGVKTPWSMYNEITWQKTHRFAGFVGTIAGVLVLILGCFFKEMINSIILLSIVILYVVSITIASYIYYKKEKEKEL